MTNAQAGDEAGGAPTPEDEAAHSLPAFLPPGGPAAAEQGCCCSVLANATYRAGVSGVEPLIDPTCTLHLTGIAAAASGAPTAPATLPDHGSAPVPVPGSGASAITAPIPVVRSTVGWSGATAA